MEGKSAAEAVGGHRVSDRPRPKALTLPLSRAALQELRAGEEVLLSGTLLVGRDQVHRRLYDLIQAGQPLPVPIRGETIYYMGPAPAPPGMPIGSCGPTTSARMDPFTPTLLDEGLLAMIGKGPRSKAVIDAIISHGAVYWYAYGGCGALYARRVTAVETAAFPELGPEALYRLTVRDFPVVTAVDARGNSIL